MLEQRDEQETVRDPLEGPHENKGALAFSVFVRLFHRRKRSNLCPFRVLRCSSQQLQTCEVDCKSPSLHIIGVGQFEDTQGDFFVGLLTLETFGTCKQVSARTIQSDMFARQHSLTLVSDETQSWMRTSLMGEDHQPLDEKGFTPIVIA